MDTLRERALAALTTFPAATDWAAAGLLLLLALVALPLGLRRGFLRREDAPLSRPAKARIAALVFVSPAFLEELLFRALPIPHPAERATPLVTAFWAVISLALFVAYHPAKAALSPSLRKTSFTNPDFLTLAGLLGAVCTVAYLRSGSVWPPTILHGASVAAWLLYFGGWRRMDVD